MKFLISRNFVVGLIPAALILCLCTFCLNVNTANAQANTVFTDTSLNPKNVTSFGNAKINAGESKFGGLVGSFDGDGDYLSIAPNPLIGTTKSLTIEAWVYLESVSANGWPVVSQSVNAIGGEQQLFVSGSNGGEANQSKLRFSRGAGVSNPIDLIGATSLPLNQWVHVAVSVDGTTAKLFVNGNLDASVATTAGWVETDQPFFVATTLNLSTPQNQSYAQGKVSDLRITKDSARYKTPFIPYAAQLIDSSNNYDPDWPNDSLLITGDGNNGSTSFIDLSPLPKKIAVNGNAQISTLESKSGGSSIYLDGNGDFLTVSHNTDLSILNSDMAIDVWIKPLAVGAVKAIATKRPTSGYANEWALVQGSDNKIAWIGWNGKSDGSLGFQAISTSTAMLGQWMHVRAVRTKTNAYLYINGVLESTVTISLTGAPAGNTTGVYIGRDPTVVPGRDFNGYIDDLRITTGLEASLNNFMPSALPPLPARTGDAQWLQVSLLLNANGANNATNFADASSQKAISKAGNVKISTAQSKFGDASAYFDGNGDSLSMGYHEDFNLRSKNFTIEGWSYVTAYSGSSLYGTILSKRNGGGDFDYVLFVNGSSKELVFTYGTDTSARIDVGSGANSLPLNTWHHFAVTCEGPTIKLFLNGKLVRTSIMNGALKNRALSLDVGKSMTFSDSYFAGYLDDIRITRGVARYTGDFTPLAIQSEPARFVKDPYGSRVSLLLMSEASPIDEDFPFVLNATNTISSNLSLDGVITRFSAPMEPTSMLASQVSVTDSTQKTYPVSSVTQLNDFEFEFKFSPALLAGTYNFKMWPDTLGVNGLPLDQNNNGIGGEVADTYTQTIVVEGALPSPVNITVNPEGNGTGTNISLSWSGYTKNPNGKPIASFRIYSSLNTYSNISQANLLKEVAGTVTTTNLDGLLNNTTHYITVVAVDTDGAFIGQAVPVAVKPISAVLQSTAYTYSTTGQILTEDGPRLDVNDITTYTYDATGNRATVTNARGHVAHYNAYDGMGRLLSMTDANNVVSEFTYHDRGWLLSSRIKHPSNNVLDSVTTYSYDPVGLMIGMTLPSGYQLTYEYDGARRLTAIQNAEGERIEYTVDAAGNRTQQKIKNNAGTIVYSVAQAFDELSRVMAITGNNGQNEKHQYDANDNTTAVTDGRNNKTEQTYDALNRVAKVIDPSLKETQFTYDAQDRIKTVTDARGNTTTYNYDGFGNLISQSSPDTGITRFSYDTAGNRTSAVDARGVVVNYSYDALNRLTLVDYPASPTENIAYTYDGTANGNFGVGKLTSVVNGSASVSYSYNYLGLISQKRSVVNGITALTEYAYDKSGNLTSVTYPSGRIVSYVRDAAGRVEAVKTKANSLATEQNVISSIAYLPFGPAKSYTFGNGLTHAVSFDTDYRITSIEVGGVLARNYEYDNADNISKIADSLATSKTQDFTYDPLNRLTSANGGYGYQAFSYDDVGNRTGLLFDNGTTILSDTYNYETNSNRLSSIDKTTGGLASGTRNFVYDEAGNRTQGTAEDGTAQTFSYNKANRLSSTRVSGNVVGIYTYNALGQRISKTYADNSKELFHYDEAGQLIAVTNANGVVQREYIYNGSVLVGFVSGGNLNFVHTDHLTTPQVVTNQSQAVVWMADYEPFGKAKLGLFNNISLDSRFPGQYLDSETGLYYNYFRDYDPSIGRYIESDPIGLRGGINTYAYVEGNPLKGIDPTGLIAVHGNWCGPNWTGGHKYPYSPHPDGYYEKPTDGLDAACQVHDVCYYECRTTNPCDKGARSACFLKCDVNLSTIAKADNSFAGSLVGKAMDRPAPRDPEKNPSGCGCDEPTLPPWPTYDQMMKK